MILKVAEVESKFYRDGTLSALVFETIFNMEEGDSIAIEKVEGMFGGVVDFHKFRVTLSRIAKQQSFRVATKIEDGKLKIHRIK